MAWLRVILPAAGNYFFFTFYLKNYMGRYMTVVLKKHYMNDLFISSLNEELAAKFGANTGVKFNTPAYVREEVDFMNYDPEGLKQVPHWKRPITIEVLQTNAFWLRIGEFSFKLSAAEGAVPALDAVAICKWLIKTKCRYIDRVASDNYDLKIVREYLDWVFKEEGYDLNKLWEGYADKAKK